MNKSKEVNCQCRARIRIAKTIPRTTTLKTARIIARTTAKTKTLRTPAANPFQCLPAVDCSTTERPPPAVQPSQFVQEAQAGSLGKENPTLNNKLAPVLHRCQFYFCLDGPAFGLQWLPPKSDMYSAVAVGTSTLSLAIPWADGRSFAESIPLTQRIPNMPHPAQSTPLSIVVDNPVFDAGLHSLLVVGREPRNHSTSIPTLCSHAYIPARFLPDCLSSPLGCLVFLSSPHASPTVLLPSFSPKPGFSAIHGPVCPSSAIYFTTRNSSCTFSSFLAITIPPT